MTILITGVAGLIGSRLAKYLIGLNSGYTIVGIDDLSGGYIENVDSSVIFYKRDLSVDSIKDIFEEYNPEIVYHFACYAAEGLSPFMRRFNYSNNIGATMNIIDECINYGVKKLVYASSMSVYGRGVQEGAIFDEETPCNPIDPYGISKYACEMDIKVAGEQHGLNWVIIRPHNVFGIGQNIWDRYRNVLGIWMYQAMHNEPMLIYGDGEQTRAFSYIDNSLPCFAKAGLDDGINREIINLGGISGCSINDACKMVSNIIGYDKVMYMEPRHEVKYAVPSYQKSIDVLGYKEENTLEYGLKEMWEWAKRQPDRDRKKWEEYEITKNIYNYWK